MVLALPSRRVLKDSLAPGRAARSQGRFGRRPSRRAAEPPSRRVSASYRSRPRSYILDPFFALTPLPKPRPKPRRVSKTERWLNLLAFLLDRRFPVAREQILSEVDDYRADWLKGTPTARESVRRKFERDKSELRELGIVIEPERKKVAAEHTEGEVEAYLLRPRDLYLPYLELLPERLGGSAARRLGRPYSLPSATIKSEEFAVLRRAAERVLALGPTPLGASAASALRKLSFDLPGVASPDDEIALAQPVGSGFEKIFTTLREGVERKVAVRCRYYAIGRDEERDRVIEAYGLMLSWGYWYCIARARDRDAIRVFRLDRMRSAELLQGEGARFPVPAGFSVQSYLDRAPWELSETPPVTARVRIKFPTRDGPSPKGWDASSNRWTRKAAPCSNSTSGSPTPSSAGCSPSATRSRWSSRVSWRPDWPMSESACARSTADMAPLAQAQIQRLVALVASMSQRDSAEPVRYRDAARRLGIPEETLRGDLQALLDLTDRYKPWLGSLSVLITADGFVLGSRGAFRRPFRLSRDEALALMLGLTGVPGGKTLAARLGGDFASAPEPGDLDRAWALGPYTR